MSFPKGYFDNAQLNVLESAFRLACLELGIDRADELQRERVAILIARNHRATYGNAAQLKDYAVQHFSPCKHYKGPRSKEEQWIITVNRRGTLTPYLESTLRNALQSARNVAPLLARAIRCQGRSS